MVPVGGITMQTGHAGRGLKGLEAIAHYDETGTTVADVRAVNGRHGLWISGVMRDVPDSQVEELRRATLSGDWRSFQGTRELLAILAVNVPGFPVPRPAVTVTASALVVDEDADCGCDMEDAFTVLHQATTHAALYAATRTR